MIDIFVYVCLYTNITVFIWLYGEKIILPSNSLYFDRRLNRVVLVELYIARGKKKTRGFHYIHFTLSDILNN